MRIIDYLKHVIDEANFLINYSTDIEKNDYLENPVLKKAFERSLGNIGEALNQIPKRLREKYPNIEWRSIIGMRHILVHQYFSVDHDIVWDAVKNEVPLLKTETEKLLSQIECENQVDKND